MIPKEYGKLISKLYEKSQQMKVKWGHGKETDSFIAVFHDFSLVFSKKQNNTSGKITFLIDICNDKSEVIDSFSVSKEDENAPLMQELFYVARRKAYKIDEAIKSIMIELSKD